MALLQNKSPFQVLKVGFPDPDLSLVFLDLYYLACKAQTFRASQARCTLPWVPETFLAWFPVSVKSL